MSTNLRLYQIVDTKLKKPLPDLFFSDLYRARQLRTTLNANEIDQTGIQAPRYVVSPGPDHKKFKGETAC